MSTSSVDVLPVSLSEYLSADNAWTARFLGDDKFSRKRDNDQIEREYNQDKYGKLASIDLESAELYKEREFEFGGVASNDSIVVSFGESLFKMPLRLARNIFYGIVKSTVAQWASPNICELGCGYGYNLTYLPGTTSGGEFSEHAVTLGRRLGLNVRRFDYYDAADYNSLIPDNCTILTVHSLEQIPDARVVVENLRRQKHSIATVVHIEPSYVPERHSLLGVLRNRYIEFNDYNRNIIDVLESSSDVEILEVRTDVVGLNPLNSAHAIVWRFR